MTATTISTTANYDETLAEATSATLEQVSDAGFPEGERVKAVGDALNNVWVEGITVGEWVEQAVARV